MQRENGASKRRRWLSPHFPRGQNTKNPVLCSQAPRKRLLRRLLDPQHYSLWLQSTVSLLPSFSSKSRQVTEKHALPGRDMLRNQTFQVLRRLINKYYRKIHYLTREFCRKFKLGIPAMSKDFINEVTQMKATRRISEICERYRINRSFQRL